MTKWLYLAFMAFLINACSSHTDINRTFNAESYIKIEGKDCNMYFDGTPPSDTSYKVYWDGKCKDGFPDGIGRELSSSGIEFIALYDDKLPYYAYNDDNNSFLVGNYLDDGDFIGILFDDYTKYYQVIYKKDGKSIILESNSFIPYLQNKDMTKPLNNIDIKDPNIMTKEIKNALKESLKQYKKSLHIINDYKSRICSMKSLKDGAYNAMIKAYKIHNLNNTYFSICNQNMDYHTRKIPKYIIEFLDSL